MSYYRPLLLLLFAALLLLGAGCPCDPENTDPDEVHLCQLLADLTQMAYGPLPSSDYERPHCPLRLVCEEPYCQPAQDNGSFEDPLGDENGWGAAAWYGDRVYANPKWDDHLNNYLACDGQRVLQFYGTRPAPPYRRENRPSSRSAQVYQIIPYQEYMKQAGMKRLRVQAVFASYRVPPDPGPIDTQFGVLLEAYAGDPAAFPADREPEQDPEDIPRETSAYRLLTKESTVIYSASVYPDVTWKAARASLHLPDETDFVVVLIEAYENAFNDEPSGEFGNAYVDRVEITFDGGPYLPYAVPDSATTTEGVPVRIFVLRNDDDPDGWLLHQTLEVIDEPDHGSTAIESHLAGILYTPAPGFTGTDTFTYAVESDDGNRITAPVTIDVVPDTNRPPVALSDTFVVAADTPTALDILANDFDPDDHAFLIIASSPNTFEGGRTEVISGGQAVRYTSPPGFSGMDHFNYVIQDIRGATSGETRVTVEVDNSNRAPVVTAPFDDMTVRADPQETCTIDLDDHFADPDGDALTYSHTLTGTAAIVTLNGSTLTVASYLGQTTVYVTAEDPGGRHVNDWFEVTGGFTTDCGGNQTAP